ncbi:MAG: glycosyltransferase [Bacteroidia bacterium]
MVEKRKYLYVILTKFPFKGGEPFFEEELHYLGKAFLKVYLIIPEGHRISDHAIGYSLPENVDVIHFDTIPDFKSRIKAFMYALNMLPAEFNSIKKNYKQKPGLFHFKTMLGFLAMAVRFNFSFQKIINNHGHEPKDVSIYSYWFFYATAGLAIIKKKSPDYLITTRIHGWDCFFERGSGNYLPLRPFVFSTLNHVVSISAAGRNYTQKKLPELHHKIELSYLGIQDFNLSEPSRRPERPGLKIVSIAYIDPVKRLERIPEAIALCNSIPIIWIHIGGGPEDLKINLEQKAKETGKINRQFSFSFTGNLRRTEIYSILNTENPDILICTSASEGLPVSMMEAMAHGIPVLSVDVGGISEIIEDGVNGWLLPAAADANEIAQKIIEIEAMDEKRFSEIKKAAFHKYSEKFKASINYSKFAEAFLNA